MNTSPTLRIQKAVMVRSAAFFIMLVMIILPGFADAQAIPQKLQAVLLKKILMFDRALPKDKPPKVIIFHAPDEAKDAESLLALFKEVGFDASMGKASDVNLLQGASAAYVFPKALVKDVKEAALKNQVLTVGGDGSWVEKGDVAVGLGIQDGKPKILVHLPLTKSQSHDLSADLLNLATVIR